MTKPNAYDLRDLLIRLGRNDNQFEHFQRVVKGVTVGKDVSNSCAVTGRDGWIWVNELRLGRVVQVFNQVVPELVNVPVLVGYSPKPPHRRQVIDVNWSDIQILEWYDDGDVYGAGPHAATHEWPDGEAGSDVVDVFRRAIVPLRVYPGTDTGIYAGVYVDVAPMYYDYLGILEYYAGDTDVDLSAYVPSNDFTLTYVLIYLDVATGNITTISQSYEGTPYVGDNTPGANIEDHIPYFPNVPDQGIPAAVVVLDAANVIVAEADIIDVRSLWNIYEDFHPIVLSMPSTLTIDLDAAITVTEDYHLVSGGGLYTVLDTISGGQDYQILVLQAAVGETITVEHNAGGIYQDGNIYLNSEQDFTLTGDKSLLLFYDGTNWSDFGDGNTGLSELYGHETDPDAHHAPVTLASASSLALTKSYQELTLDAGIMGLSLAIPIVQMLPGLVGFWPGWIVGSGTTGNLHFTDLSGHGLDLTRNGGILQASASGAALATMSEMFLNGTTGYANISDNDILSILGTESGIAAAMRGLTLCSWVKFDVSGNSEGIITKAASLFSDSSAYGIYKGSGDVLRLSVSDGTAVSNGTSLSVPIGEWVFVAGVFSAANEELITYMGTAGNGLESITDDIAGTSDIQDTIQQFVIGGTSGGGNLMDGHMSLPFVCCAAVPSELITALFQHTKALFGV